MNMDPTNQNGQASTGGQQQGNPFPPTPPTPPNFTFDGQSASQPAPAPIQLPEQVAPVVEPYIQPSVPQPVQAMPDPVYTVPQPQAQPVPQPVQAMPDPVYTIPQAQPQPIPQPVQAMPDPQQPVYQQPYDPYAQPQPVQPQQPMYQQPYDPYAQPQPVQPQQPMYQQPVQPQQPMYQQPVMPPQPQQPMYQPPVQPQTGGFDPMTGAPIGGAATSGQQPAQDEEDTTPANFQVGKDLPAELGVPVPAHSLNFDENYFMRLLAGSISLSKAEKKRIIDSIPKLKQSQVDELINIFEDEKAKFAELPKKHTAELDKLAASHLEDWIDIETEYKALGQKDEEAAKAEEIRKSLGL